MDKEFAHWFNVAAAESEEGRGQKEEDAGFLFPGFGGSVQALCHYMLGSGKTLEINFVHVAPFFPKLSRFENFKKELEKYRGTSTKTHLNITDGYTVQPLDWLTYGSITLIIEGDLQTNERGWVFDGTLRAKPDDYNFDVDKSHRSKLGEYCTKQGSKLPGEDFKIRFKGFTRVHDSRRW
jgi:hypothetical protein